MQREKDSHKAENFRERNTVIKSGGVGWVVVGVFSTGIFAFWVGSDP